MLEEFQGEKVIFVEQSIVRDGVTCDVYLFPNDSSKDLAIVKIEPNSYTPKQEILKGDRIIEGLISGKGLFIKNGKEEIVKSKEIFEVDIGDTMQWKAGEVGLQFYEICYPPYQDGRFKHLT
jgi:hypothetical protein